MKKDNDNYFKKSTYGLKIVLCSPCTSTNRSRAWSAQACVQTWLRRWSCACPVDCFPILFLDVDSVVWPPRPSHTINVDVPTRLNPPTPPTYPTLSSTAFPTIVFRSTVCQALSAWTTIEQCSTCGFPICWNASDDFVFLFSYSVLLVRRCSTCSLSQYSWLFMEPFLVPVFPSL